MHDFVVNNAAAEAAAAAAAAAMPRSATLPRLRERRVDVPPAAEAAENLATERPLLGRLQHGGAVPVMGAHAVEFIRTASRRLRPRRAGGQPEELPAAFRRNRLPLY